MRGRKDYYGKTKDGKRKMISPCKEGSTGAGGLIGNASKSGQERIGRSGTGERDNGHISGSEQEM